MSTDTYKFEAYSALLVTPEEAEVIRGLLKRNFSANLLTGFGFKNDTITMDARINGLPLVLDQRAKVSK